MVWKILKAGGFEEGQKIEYYKLPKRFKLLVTHSIVDGAVWRCDV